MRGPGSWETRPASQRGTEAPGQKVCRNPESQLHPHPRAELGDCSFTSGRALGEGLFLAHFTDEKTGTKK